MSAAAMIDLETMAVTPDAAILAIGACVFNLHEEGKIYSQFSMNISIESNEEKGRRIQGSTVAWWLKQSDAARMALFDNPTNLPNALKSLRMWMQETKPAVTTIWANDPDFDIVILKSAFDACGELWPYGFWMNRSVRTIQELAYPDPEDLKVVKTQLRAGGVHHRAVDDAIMQARLVQHCYRILNPCAVEIDP